MSLMYRTSNLFNRARMVGVLLVVCPANCQTCNWDSVTATATCKNCVYKHYLADDGSCDRKCFL